MNIPHLPPGFANDPIASHSGRFPLGQSFRPAGFDPVSRPSERPWGLRGMRVARQQGDPVRAAFHYEHATQTAVDDLGRTLVAADPTANKVTSNDGDEGPSEDFTYDFCPDFPAST